MDVLLDWVELEAHLYDSALCTPNCLNLLVDGDERIAADLLSLPAH